MKLGRGLLVGLVAGPALGALAGLGDCVRSLIAGGSILSPPHWLTVVILYAALFLPIAVVVGGLAALLFPRGERAAVLLLVIGTATFFVGAWANEVWLPSFRAPESLHFDAWLHAGSVALFMLCYFLPFRPSMPRSRAWIGLLVAAIAVGAAGKLFAGGGDTSRVPLTESPGAHPNVLFVLVDTLRADHVSALGYARKTTPHLDAFAAGGALFTDCRSAASWTKPAVASLLTGLLPSAHGAVEHQDVLSPAATTLAEVFRSAGYDTAAFSDNPFISPEFGFGQGFQSFDYLAPSVFVNGTLLGKAMWTLGLVSLGGRMNGEKLASARGAPVLFSRFLAWMGRRKAGRPWFAYVHTMEPHVPYSPPKPFRGRFSDPSYRGPDLDRPPTYMGFLPFDRGPSLPPAEKRHLVARYDEEILAFDSAFGDLVAKLKERHVLAKTIVVVVADHGEEFHEHGGWTHGDSLYDDLLHVPLVMRGPGIEPARIGKPVSSRDVFSTLLDLCGIHSRSPAPGVDLADTLEKGAPVPAVPIVSEVESGGAGAESIVFDRHKLILAHQGPEKRALAFDLASDPGEQHPLASPPWEKRLKRTLLEIVAAARRTSLGSKSREFTPQERRELKGLGYLK